MKWIFCFFLILLPWNVIAQKNDSGELPFLAQWGFFNNLKTNSDEKNDSSVYSIEDFDIYRLRKELDDLEDLEKFTELRNVRSYFLLGIPKIKNKLAAQEAETAGLIVEIEEKKSQLRLSKKKMDSLTGRVENVVILSWENELKELRLKKKYNESTEIEYENEIQLLNKSINEAKKQNKDTEELLESIIVLEKEIKKLEEDHDLKLLWISVNRETLVKAQEALEVVEQMINELLIPETEENKFKLYVTIAFIFLVGIVIVGFFVISIIDSSVRKAIFSNQSGIQFITLFSLVIAIILFGITGVLGGKELAALLGGISGYILGRVSDKVKKADDTIVSVRKDKK